MSDQETTLVEDAPYKPMQTKQGGRKTDLEQNTDKTFTHTLNKKHL